MERSFEAVLVEQCATTLAGVKPASLFRYQGADKRQPREAAARWAKELAPGAEYEPLSVDVNLSNTQLNE